MKTILRNKKSLMITFVLLVTVIAVIGFWQSHSAEAIRIESSGDYLSIDTSLAPEAGHSEGPPGIYSGSVVTEKSPNYYEIDYPGSGGKIGIGEASKASNFKPDLTISTWNGEAEFKLTTLTNMEEKSQLATSLAGDTISASNGEWEFKYKPTAPKEGFNENGGIDILITAKKKPASNIIEFTYISDTVRPYYEAPLTDKYKNGWSDEFLAEITVSATQVINAKDGSILVKCPEYVVNSIAFYSDNKSGDMTVSGGKNYRTGKVGHLYRMKAVDSVGKWAWLDWALPSETQIRLTDTTGILQTGVYPITMQPVGDTFGYTGVGAYANGSADYMFMGKAAPAAGGTLNTISVYILSAVAGNTVKCALYNASTLALVATTEEKAVANSPGWVSFAVAGTPSVSAGVNYWIVFWNGGATANLAYDTGAPYGTGGYRQQTYGSYPNPMSSPNLQPSFYSIYVTYTPGSSPSISNTPSSYNFGVVTPSTTLSTGLNYFSVTNNSGSAVNITIGGTDITGGITWTLSDTATPGTATAGMKAGLNGGAYNIIVKKTAPFNTLKSNLSSSASQGWGFQLLAPTNSTDTIQKAGTVTLTATTP